jgi:hypothetical protein
MINYHILTYLTPQAFIEDDPLPIAPPTFVFEDDSWRQLIPKVRQTLRRPSFGGMFTSSVLSPVPPPVTSTLSVDEETWQHCILFNLKWRTSLWFAV